MPSGKGKTIYLAVQRFRLGSVSLSGGSNVDAWRDLGFDLDRKCTSAADSETAVGLCRRPPMASTDSMIDGDRCRDNNFGRYIGTSVRTVAPNTEPDLNSRIYDGQRTWVLEIADADLGDDAYAPGRLWDVRDERPLGVKMKWDGTDVRTATEESVIGRDLEKPRITFPKGYIVDDTWVSGEDEEHTFVLPMTNAYLLPVRLRRTTFVLSLDPDRANGHQGTVAGAFDRDAMVALIDELVRFGGQCPGSPLYMNALTASTNAFDVSLDSPSLQDPTKECDGLSIGIGIDVRAVMPLAGVGPPRNPRVDTCDAGTD
jgi:hypothetical protein